MILFIVFSLIFIIVLSTVLVFIFDILVPSLKAQKVPLERTLFSESEIRIKPSYIESFSNANGNRAVILCSPEKSFESKRYVYNGEQSCAIYKTLYDTETDCIFGCFGFGDCARACTRNAISISGKTAVVNELCNGCGNCIDICPQKLIKIIPSSQEECVLCNAPLNGKISCSKKCAKSSLKRTTSGAIKFWKGFYKLICGKE